MKISNKAITNKFLIKSFFIAILIIGVSATIVFAWTEPTLSPPDGNASAPINIGTTSQGKLGNLGVGTTTPIEKFEIYSGNIRVRRPDNSATMGQLLTQGVDDLWRTYTTNDSASDLRFRAGATDHMTIQYSTGNVGIGTTDPGVYKLNLNGQILATSYIRSNSYIQSRSTTPYLDLYQDGQQEWKIGQLTAGSKTLTLQATGAASPDVMTLLSTGNVGIGTTIPAYKLDVVDDTNDINVGIRATAASKAVYLRLEGTHTTYGGVIYKTSGADTWKFGNFGDTADSFNIYTAGSNRMTVLSGGNVGIGTTIPTTILDINGALTTRGMAAPATSPAGQGRIYFDSTANVFKVSENGGAYTNLAGNSYWAQTATGNHIYNNNTGNVGIGTSATPLALLHVLGVSVVDGTSARRNLVLQDSATAAQGVGGGVSFGGKYAAAGSATQDFANIWGIKENANDNDYAGALLFGTRINTGVPTERMRISSGGNVGIGTTLPSYPLTVNGIVQIGTNLYLNGGTTKYLYASGSELRIGSLGGSGFISFYGNDGSNREMMRMTGANLGIGTTGPNKQLHVYNTSENAEMDIQSVAGTNKHWAIYHDATSADLRFWHNDITGEKNILTLTDGGSIGIGTIAPISPLSVAIQYAKTDTTDRSAISMLTNDTNPFKLNFSITGAAAIADRAAILQTSDSGLAYGGNLILQPNTGNVGIGTTIPQKKLDVDGDSKLRNDIYLTNNKSLRLDSASNTNLLIGNYNTGGFAYGTGETASLAVEGDVKGNRLCIQESCKDTWGAIAEDNDWSGAGTGQMYATAITDNVGIGTTVPTELLHLKKDQAAYTNIKIENTNSAGAAQVFMINDLSVYTQGLYGSTHAAYGAVSANGGFTYFNGAGGLTLMADNAAGIIKFATGGNSEKVRIDSAGNVGIGTTNPIRQTQIHGIGQTTASITDAGDTGAMLLVSSSGNGANTGGAIAFSARNDNGTTVPQWAIKSLLVNGTANGIGDLVFSGRNGTADVALTERIRFKNGGNVGIGTTNPLEKLEVYSGNIRTHRPDNSTTMGYLSTQAGTDLWRTYTTNDSASDLRFRAGATDHMAIKYSTGYVGIGTTGPTHNFQVNGYNTTGTSVINTNGSYNFTNPPTTYPRSLGLGIISGPVAADIPLSGLTGWKSGYGGYIGVWSDVTAATEGNTNAAGVVSILRGAPTGSNAFGFYSDLSNFSGSGGNTKYGIYSTGETYDYFAGNVGIGTTIPGAMLHVYGSVNIGTASAGNAQLNMMDNNIIGVNKLTVSTIDPVYEIDGKKYATYAASIAGGVKEEYTGKAKLFEIKTQEYEYIIDFDKIEVGSDLWVWKKAVDFSRDNVDILITPYGESADIYYLIEGNKIIIRGDKPVEFSYRLTGKRFDWQNWPTLSKDQNEKASFIIK